MAGYPLNPLASAFPATAPDAGNGPGHSQPHVQPAASTDNWLVRSEHWAETKATSAEDYVSGKLKSASDKANKLAEQVMGAKNWEELQAIVLPVLGQFSYSFGLAVGLVECVTDLVTGLFKLQKMLVMAALYEEFTQVESDHPFRALMMEVTTDVIPGVIEWKATLLAIGQSGLWPSFYSDMKEADDQVRALVREVENFFSHPIDTVVKFAKDKWEGAKKDWEKYKSLVASGEPRKMFEAGVMAGKVLGNLILTILAIVSLYGLAVRAAQVVAMGARVVFGLVTLEVAEANVVAAETALAAARTAAAEASGAIESAQAARSITAAEKALEAARLQRSLAQAGEKLPTLTRRVMSEIKEAPKTPGEAGKGGGEAGDGAGSPPPRTSPAPQAKTASKSFKGKLKGADVELKDVDTQSINYTKRSPADTKALRNAFDSNDRSAFLKYLGTDPARVSELKAAGFSDAQIADIADGNVPDGWQVHHKLPLDDGGTNSPSNLILMQNDPYHKVITNAQRSLTSGMNPGDTRTIDFPVPAGYVYPQAPN